MVLRPAGVIDTADAGAARPDSDDATVLLAEWRDRGQEDLAP
jgi:hypothetical protein